MTFYSQLTFLIVSASVGLALGDGRYAALVHPDVEFLFRTWGPIAAGDWALLGMLGVSGVFGVFLISQAFRLSEAAFAAPFEYVAMPLAILWGVTVFGTWPDRLAWLGILLIIGSGLFLIWREARKGRAMKKERHA